jgi:hypothetical protein
MGAAATEKQAEGRSWPGELRSWLSTPLLVTVVAALIGSLLLPSITRKWQDHQKALAIKTDLVSDMSQSASSAVANSRFIAAGLVGRSSQAAGAEQQAWNDVYRDWTTQGASIGAKLEAYFGPEIAAAWQKFTYALTDYVSLSASAGSGSGRRPQVEELYAYRSKLPGVHLTRAHWQRLAGPPEGAEFEEAYSAVGRGLLARQNELVSTVLRAHASGF